MLVAVVEVAQNGQGSVRLPERLPAVHDLLVVLGQAIEQAVAKARLRPVPASPSAVFGFVAHDRKGGPLRISTDPKASKGVYQVVERRPQVADEVGTDEREPNRRVLTGLEVSDRPAGFFVEVHVDPDRLGLHEGIKSFTEADVQLGSTVDLRKRAEQGIVGWQQVGVRNLPHA